MLSLTVRYRRVSFLIACITFQAFPFPFVHPWCSARKKKCYRSGKNPCRLSLLITYHESDRFRASDAKLGSEASDTDSHPRRFLPRATMESKINHATHWFQARVIRYPAEIVRFSRVRRRLKVSFPAIEKYVELTQCGRQVIKNW